MITITNLFLLVVRGNCITSIPLYFQGSADAYWLHRRADLLHGIPLCLTCQTGSAPFRNMLLNISPPVPFRQRLIKGFLGKMSEKSTTLPLSHYILLQLPFEGSGSSKIPQKYIIPSSITNWKLSSATRLVSSSFSGSVFSVKYANIYSPVRYKCSLTRRS